MKFRQSDRTVIDRCPLRTKPQCRAFLEDHFLYQGTYAVRVRVRDIRNKLLEEENALWEAISYEGNPAWDAYDFGQEDYCKSTGMEFTFILEGRSNGYAVLHSSNKDGQGVHPVQLLDEMDHATREELLREARMVRKFDLAIEDMIRNFIASAMSEYKEKQKNEAIG